MTSLSLVLVACGGGGDDDDDTDAEATEEQTDSDADATTDSDDEGDGEDEDDDDSEDPDFSGGGSEEEYVASLCTAFDDYIAALVQAGSDPEFADLSEEEQLPLYEEPFANMVSALEDLDPPGDIEEFHDQVLDIYREMLEKVENGDVTVFDDAAEAEIEAPPAELTEKYDAIAAEIPVCQDSGFTFGE